MSRGNLLIVHEDTKWFYGIQSLLREQFDFGTTSLVNHESDTDFPHALARSHDLIILQDGLLENTRDAFMEIRDSQENTNTPVIIVVASNPDGAQDGSVPAIFQVAGNPVNLRWVTESIAHEALVTLVSELI